MTKREYEKTKNAAEKPAANPLAEIEAELKLEGYAIYRNAEYANERREDGLTKLMVAANRPDQGKAKHLIAQGADTELTDARGDTALIMAVSKGYYYPAMEILKGHANIHHKNRKGIQCSPCRYCRRTARTCGDYLVLRLLMEKVSGLGRSLQQEAQACGRAYLDGINSIDDVCSGGRNEDGGKAHCLRVRRQHAGKPRL